MWDFRVVDRGMTVCHFDMAPALQWREDHEEISDAVALVFVVVSLGLSGLGRDRLAGLDDQLLRSLVQTHERSIRISRPLVSFQHVFHGRHEAGVGLGRDHPLPIAVRLERVFFNVRPIVLSLALPTMANSTMRIPIQSGRGFRFEAGRHSDLKPAAIPK